MLQKNRRTQPQNIRPPRKKMTSRPFNLTNWRKFTILNLKKKKDDIFLEGKLRRCINIA